MKSQFAGKVVIIVGASSGIGQVTALELAGKGAKLVIQVSDLPLEHSLCYLIRHVVE